MKLATKCVYCDKSLEVKQTASEISPIDCVLALEIPGFVCPKCVNENPDSQDSELVKVLSESDAVDALLNMGFESDVADVVSFFTLHFSRRSRVIQASAVRLHMEGLRQEAYDLLEVSIDECDNPDVLRLELAALAGMDGSPDLGLSYIEDVSDDTERYHVIKGNLLKEIEEWDTAAECWQLAIDNDPMHIVSWYNLGYYWAVIQEDHARAAQHYRDACKQFPDELQFQEFAEVYGECTEPNPATPPDAEWP